MTLSTASSPFSVGTTAVQVSPSTGVTNSYTIVIQNNHASNIVYVGTSKTVTSSSYGAQLTTGQSVGLDDLKPTDQVWVISSGASTPVGVMAILR